MFGHRLGVAHEAAVGEPEERPDQGPTETARVAGQLEVEALKDHEPLHRKGAHGLDDVLGAVPGGVAVAVPTERREHRIRADDGLRHVRRVEGVALQHRQRVVRRHLRRVARQQRDVVATRESLLQQRSADETSSSEDRKSHARRVAPFPDVARSLKCVIP